MTGCSVPWRGTWAIEPKPISRPFFFPPSDPPRPFPPSSERQGERECALQTRGETQTRQPRLSPASCSRWSVSRRPGSQPVPHLYWRLPHFRPSIRHPLCPALVLCCALSAGQYLHTTEYRAATAAPLPTQPFTRPRSGLQVPRRTAIGIHIHIPSSLSTHLYRRETATSWWSFPSQPLPRNTPQVPGSEKSYLPHLWAHATWAIFLLDTPPLRPPRLLQHLFAACPLAPRPLT